MSNQRSGVCDAQTIIGLCNRLRICPKSERGAIIREIIDCAEADYPSDEDDAYRATIEDGLANVRERMSAERDPARLAALVGAARRLRARLKR